ncbi:Hypothetical predicted protein [Mytilus galloprovincialis]|uniref:CCHC-type domain-containing protein n=1 Tax=Mytilus galloprovincialis TaxID=29158 RepID=A0A8B6H8L4_MYTGA|nr:Hypothetical predicted protein [Mytilus galloprovincialis]
MSKDWENEWESDICSRQSMQTNPYYDDKHLKPSRNVSDSTENVNNMAPTYAKVTAGNLTINTDTNGTKTNDTNGVKPIFIKETDVFGASNPPKELWLTHLEIFRGMSMSIKREHIKGIQRIGRMWRLYLDAEEDRLKLLNDGQIQRELEKRNIKVISINRDRLRVDNQMTDCETGDRVVFCEKFEEQLPKTMQFGKYLARVSHFGQIDINTHFICSKCLQHGHFTSDCPNEWMCRGCNKSGHKLINCPTFFENMRQKETKDQQEKENQITEPDNIMQETTQKEHIEDITHQHNQEVNKTDGCTDLSIQLSANLEQNITVTTDDKQNLTPEKKKEKKKKNIPEKNESLSHSAVSKTNNSGKQTSQKQLDINRFTTPNRRQENLKGRTPPTPPSQDKENKAAKT